MNTTSGTAAVYVRISDDPKLLALGVQRQERECRQKAASLGWTVDAVYSDNDTSAFKRTVQRRDWLRLQDDIRAGRVTRLVFWDPDRIVRQPRELEPFVDLVNDAGCQTAAVTGEYDPSTADGRMMIRMKGAMAARESEHKSERAVSKMQQLREAGAFTGGPRPFGWNVVNGQFIEVPKELKLLREAKDRVLAGDTIHAICRDFQARGVRGTRLVNRNGEKVRAAISDTALLTMLTSHRMVGMTAAGKPGGWTALATVDELERLRVILRTKSPGKRRQVSGKYLVTGDLLKCGLCGGPMYGAPTFAGKPSPHYGCKKLVSYQGCGRIAIGVKTLDERVMEAVAEHLTGYLYPPKVHGQRPHKARKITTSPRLAEATLESARVQRDHDDLAAAYGAGKVTMAEWLIAKRGLEPRMDAARTALEAAQAHSAGLHELAQLDTQHFVEHWREMDTAARRKVVLALVSEVRVQPHKGAYHLPDLTRVEVDFRTL